MANYSKAFNFRGGFQVDTDVLLVRGQNVGIGSTIPQERLDVDGTIFTRGLRIEADTDRGDITQIDKANVGIVETKIEGVLFKASLGQKGGNGVDIWNFAFQRKAGRKADNVLL